MFGRAALLMLSLLIAACSAERFEQIATTRTSFAEAPQTSAVMMECEYEATKLAFTRKHALTAAQEEDYLDGCIREKWIMRTYGRR